jgi:hypothetical protein
MLFKEMPRGILTEFTGMSHDQSSTGKAPFSDADIESFHVSDRHGAAAIVGLMAGIFSLGLVLYIIVALCCAADRYPAAG